MADELSTDPVTGRPEVSSGAIEENDSTPTSEELTGTQADKSGESVPGTTETSGPQEIDSFFDPKSIADKPELQIAYKQMQADYTKKMQAIAADRHKIEAYNAFEQSPEGTIRQLAQQYGLSLAEARQVVQNEEEFTPQTWDEVFAKAGEKIEQQIMSKLSPYLTEVQGLKKQTIEKFLDDKAPDWRMYESDMIELLKAHPSLSKDPEKLYRLAVPPEKYEAVAMQKALNKMQSKVSGSKVAGGSTTNKHPQAGPDNISSFEEAVQFARQKLASEGIRPGK